MQVAIIEVSCCQPFFQQHCLESHPAILEEETLISANVSATKGIWNKPRQNMEVNLVSLHRQGHISLPADATPHKMLHKTQWALSLHVTLSLIKFHMKEMEEGGSQCKIFFGFPLGKRRWTGCRGHNEALDGLGHSGETETHHFQHNSSSACSLSAFSWRQARAF